MSLFRKKDKILYAFTSGKSIPIEEVPDEVFSNKLLGEGIAIIPDEESIYAPCSGRITMVMDTSKHAVGVRNTDGMEFLLHVGLETVNLKGEGLKTHVHVGDIVEKGDLLITFNKTLLEERGINLITMLIIIEDNGNSITEFNHHNQVLKETSFLLKYQ